MTTADAARAPLRRLGLPLLGDQ